MKWAWLGLLLIGCQTAPPQPDWTPARAQVLSEGEKDHALENGRENLAVTGPPRVKVKATPKPLRVESAPRPTAGPVGPMPTTLHRSEQPARLKKTVAPGDDAPLVSSTEGNLLEATVETGVDALAGAGQTEIVFLMVDLQPKGPQLAAGCDLGLLVDVSGSVLHSEMNSAVGATADVFAQQGGDRTWLIAFGSEAQLLVDGSSRVPGRAELDAVLRASHPAGGGTVLGPAIRMVVDLLRKAPDSGKARHVMVVSDGELGDPQEALGLAQSAWKSDGISFSGILVGFSSSGEGALQNLASACNGQFVRAAGMTAAGKLLIDEANLARSIILRDLRLEARLSAGVSIRRAFLVDPTRELATSGTVQETIQLGDLHRGEKRRMLLELQVKPGVGRERTLGWISLLSKGANAKERSPQVLQQVRVLNGTKKPTVNPEVDRCVTLVYRMVTRR